MTVTDTVKHADETLAITQNQSAAMEELTATVQSLKEYADRLKEVFERK